MKNSDPWILFLRKWGTYQKERFPILAHGPLIAIFSFSAVCFSSLLRGETHFPLWPSITVAFSHSFLAFLQLRIADEIKDFEDDSLYRPYRPVPRGLVTLKELKYLGLCTALIQLVLALWLDPKLLILLCMTWTYLALMSREFFVRNWIKKHPFTYLWTHMFIVPLIDFYATACDWILFSQTPPHGLGWFVVVSFFNGMVIEIGRKLRAPEDEEKGVPTYTALWGRTLAVTAWLLALLLAALSAGYAADGIDFVQPLVLTLSFLLLVCLILCVRFLHAPLRNRAQWFEPLSGVWTLALYLALGAIPLLMKSF